jgi:methanogenic corrinoid protein MtbC1
MEKNNIWPEALPSAPSITTKPGFPPEYYKEQLYQALVTKNEIRVNDIFHEIHSAFELDVIFNNILRPSMVDIGDALYKGEISFSTEHYASSQIMNKLVSLMQVYPSRRNSAYILIGCAPTENHEISSVMLSILLRKNGYRVEYLGPDVPIDDLVDYAIYEKPDMIVLSAAMETSALELRHVQNKLSRLRKPPLFAYGGQAFYNNANLQNLINGFYLGDTLEKALTNINSQLEQTWKRNKQAISLN